MLITHLHNRAQSSNLHLAEPWRIRSRQQTTKIVTSALLILSCFIFGKTSIAQENNTSLKYFTVATTPKKTKGFTSKLHNTLWWQIANRHQLDPYILYAVALIESAKGSTKNHVTPWPWALNKAGKSIIPGHPS